MLPTRRFAISSLLAFTPLARAIADDPWPASALLQPQTLAARLGSGSGEAILFVGFPVLYRSAHIPGAVLAGPCSKAEGLNALRIAVKDVPKSRPVAIYCGCCPFDKCPNVRPAYTALKRMGFSQVQVVAMDTNFHTDWVAKGYPVERPAPAANS